MCPRGQAWHRVSSEVLAGLCRGLRPPGKGSLGAGTVEAVPTEGQRVLSPILRGGERAQVARTQAQAKQGSLGWPW